PSSGHDSPQHLQVDEMEMAPTSRVPSYSTAVRTRVPTESTPLPDYRTAVSAPRTPPGGAEINGEYRAAQVPEDGDRQASTPRTSQHTPDDHTVQRRVNI